MLGRTTSRRVSRTIGILLLGCLGTTQALTGDETLEAFERNITHDYAKNGDVAIHYASAGKGPLMIMIHGFPDFWYTWRHQMHALSKHYQTVAVDQRGYNLSDQPAEEDQFKIQHLVDDIRAVIKHTGNEKAIVVGHDWGGFVAWNVAMTYPEMTEKLVILNLPHPVALARELANNPKQQANSEYARRFQKDDAHKALTAAGLANWVTDIDARKKYVKAFERSSFEGMLNFYKANYPRPPYQAHTGPIIQVECPVLMFHGLDDWALLPGGLNGTWEFVEKDLTLVTLPGAGHFVQQDRSERVSKTILSWLQLQESLQ